jgi:hypothetical protein
MKRNPSPPPLLPKFKRNKSKHLECMLEPPIGYMKFLFLEEFITV